MQRKIRLPMSCQPLDDAHTPSRSFPTARFPSSPDCESRIFRSSWRLDDALLRTVSRIFYLLLSHTQSPSRLRKERKRERGRGMPWGRVTGSMSYPKVDVVIDMGNPFLNRTVDGFLKIGAVIHLLISFVLNLIPWNGMHCCEFCVFSCI